MKKTLALVLSVLMIATLCTVFASAESANLLAGKSYTLTGCGDYPDYKTSLVDGVAKNGLDGDDNATQWAAFYYNKDASADRINAPDGVGAAIFDLGESTEIGQIKAHLVYNVSWGIKAPSAVKAYVSDDNENWTEVGALTGSASAEGVGYWMTLDGEATGRYLKVEFTLDGIFAFVNEIEAYGVADEDTSAPSEGETSGTTSDNSSAAPVKPGDASNAIVFAIVAIVAIAGSAVVIKTRR